MLTFLHVNSVILYFWLPAETLEQYHAFNERMIGLQVEELTDGSPNAY